MDKQKKEKLLQAVLNTHRKLGVHFEVPKDNSVDDEVAPVLGKSICHFPRTKEEH